MTNIKPSNHGIVVEHKEHGTRYAVSDRNFNPDIHRKVRDLRPGESVTTYQPKRKDVRGEQASGAGSPGAAGDAGDGSATGDETLVGSPTVHETDKTIQTEGSSPEDTKGNK